MSLHIQSFRHGKSKTNRSFFFLCSLATFHLAHCTNVYDTSSSKLSVPSIGGKCYISYPNSVYFSKYLLKCLEVKRKNSREIKCVLSSSSQRHHHTIQSRWLWNLITFAFTVAWYFVIHIGPMDARSIIFNEPTILKENSSYYKRLHVLS